MPFQKHQINDINDPEAQQKYYDSLPSLNEIKKGIKLLESLDLVSISDEELQKTITESINHIPFIGNRLKRGAHIFRARINQANKPFRSVKDITAPPGSYIKTYGRANKPYERIFYGAQNILLAVYELAHYSDVIVKHNGEISLTVSMYRVEEDLHLSTIMHSKVLHERRPDILSRYERYREKFGNTLKEEAVQARDLVFDFFSNQFTKKDIKSHHEYKISAAYMGSIVKFNLLSPNSQAQDKFDGIIYPSVAMRYMGDNVALMIESVKQKIKLVEVADVVCCDIDIEKCDFLVKILQKSERIERGEIYFKKLSIPEEYRARDWDRYIPT